MGLVCLFRALSITGDAPTFLSPKDELDDIMVARNKSCVSDSVDAKSAWKAPQRKPNHTFRKSIRLHLKKRQICSSERSGSSADYESKNESSTTGRTHKLGSKCALDENTRGKKKPDCSRRYLSGRKPNHHSTNSHYEVVDHTNQRLDIKRCEVSEFSDVGQPSIVLTDRQKTSSNQPRTSASHYPNVKQPIIILFDCLKIPGVRALTNKGCVLRKSSRKKNTPDCNECSAKGSVGNVQTTRKRRRSEETKPACHVPTWRQLTKQQLRSSENLNLSNNPESSNQSRGISVENSIKSYSSYPVKFGHKRSVIVDEKHPIRIPTWRQLTKLQSECLGHQNESKYSESDSQCRKILTINEEVKSKRKRRHSEGSSTRKRSIRLSCDSGLLSSGSTSKHTASYVEEKSHADRSLKFPRETHDTSLIVLPTWRQLSILQSDRSYSHETYQKPNSIGDKNSKDSLSAMRILNESSTITLSTANLRLPTVQIPPPANSGSINFPAMQEIRPESKEVSTKTADFKVPSTGLSISRKSSAQSRSASNKHKTKSARDIIPMHNCGHEVKPELKPSASNSTKPECLEPFFKILIPDEPGEKPHFECSMCGYRINQLEMLWNHLKSHDTGEPYPCNLCDKRCRTITHLRIHQILRHKGKPLACHECDFSSADEDRLQRHLWTHRNP